MLLKSRSRPRVILSLNDCDARFIGQLGFWITISNNRESNLKLKKYVWTLKPNTLNEIPSMGESRLRQSSLIPCHIDVTKTLGTQLHPGVIAFIPLCTVRTFHLLSDHDRHYDTLCSIIHAGRNPLSRSEMSGFDISKARISFILRQIQSLNHAMCQICP